MALDAVLDIQRLLMMRIVLFLAKVVANFSVDSDITRRRETGLPSDVEDIIARAVRLVEEREILSGDSKKIQTMMMK